jgi:putative YhbY family RNA-binding protein
MKAPDLKPDERRALRAQAHHLAPVVMIGNDGLTPAVLHEIDVNLLAHGLIKIRVFSDDRAAREGLLTRIAAELDATPVQHIGKLLVVYRPVPEPERQPAAESRRKAGPPQREARGRAPRGSAREPAPDPRAAHVRRNRSRTPVVIEARRTAEPVVASAPASRRQAPRSRTAAASPAAGRTGGNGRSGGPAGKRPAGIPGRRRRTGA